MAPTTVVVAAPDPSGAAATVGDAIRGIDGVSQVSPPQLSADGQVARLQVVYADDPYDTPALERTRQIREVADEALPTGRVLVGGESANALDHRTGDLRDFTVVAVAMTVLIFAVLGLLLRALLAPLVLLATTALSLLAALGATILTWVVIGDHAGTNNRVLLYSLIFLVALGRGLQHPARQPDPRGDDQARLRRRHPGGADPHRRGDHLGGLILAGTFAVLMTQPLNSLLQFGFAMAVGLLLDTFLIRGALVPALFRLIGPRSGIPGGGAGRRTRPAKRTGRQHRRRG